MSKPIRIILALLCAAMILAMPFVLSAPFMLDSEKDRVMDDSGDEEEIDFGRLFFSTAMAEEAADGDLIVETETDGAGSLYIDPGWALPLDLSAGGCKPNPAKYTETGYEDQSIRVTVETRNDASGAVYHVAFVQIADASQFRTATTSGTAKLARDKYVTTIAEDYNTVIAMNGDYVAELPSKKSFEYRMTEKIRSKANKLKDILIIDDLGDFHLFVRSEGLKEFPEQMKKEGRKIVNAFTFGPALVVDGELQTMDDTYDFGRTKKYPRSAIGQLGPLSYAMVIVEGRGESAGITHQEMAQIMYDLGCKQAYNLDGGNTAEMIMFGPADSYGALTEKFHFKGDQTAAQRSQSDIIYFATAVPESAW